MIQLIFLIIVIIFLSPLAIDFVRNNHPQVFSSSIVSPFMERGFIGEGERVVVRVNELSEPVSLGLASQGITNVTAFALDPQNPGAFFAGTKKGDILYKIGASSWVTLEGSDFLRTRQYAIRKISFDPVDSEFIYLLVSNHKEHGIIYSKDRGRSFESLYTLQKDEEIAALAHLSGRKGTLFAATKMGLLILSEDYGISWKKIYDFKNEVISLAARESMNGFASIFVVTKSGALFLSENEGSTFKEVFPSKNEGAARKIVLGVRPGHFFIATRHNLYETQDGGVHFKEHPLPVTMDERLFISDFAISSSNEEIIYMSIGALLLKSKDGGTTWAVRNMDVVAIEEIKIDPENEDTVYLRVIY